MVAEEGGLHPMSPDKFKNNLPISDSNSLPGSRPIDEPLFTVDGFRATLPPKQESLQKQKEDEPLPLTASPDEVLFKIDKLSELIEQNQEQQTDSVINRLEELKIELAIADEQLKRTKEPNFSQSIEADKQDILNEINSLEDQKQTNEFVAQEDDIIADWFKTEINTNPIDEVLSPQEIKDINAQANFDKSQERKSKAKEIKEKFSRVTNAISGFMKRNLDKAFVVMVGLGSLSGGNTPAEMPEPAPIVKTMETKANSGAAQINQKNENPTEVKIDTTSQNVETHTFSKPDKIVVNYDQLQKKAKQDALSLLKGSLGSAQEKAATEADIEAATDSSMFLAEAEEGVNEIIEQARAPKKENNEMYFSAEEEKQNRAVPESKLPQTTGKDAVADYNKQLEKAQTATFDIGDRAPAKPEFTNSQEQTPEKTPTAEKETTPFSKEKVMSGIRHGKLNQVVDQLVSRMKTNKTMPVLSIGRGEHTIRLVNLGNDNYTISINGKKQTKDSFKNWSNQNKNSFEGRR